MRFIKILLVLFSIATFASCSKSSMNSKSIKTDEDFEVARTMLSNDPDNKSMNIDLWKYMTRSGEFDSVIRYATPVFYRNLERNTDLAADAGIYILQSYIYKEKYDSVEHYISYLEKFRETKRNDYIWNHKADNLSAVYAMKIKMDYPKAIEYFTKAYEGIKDSDNPESQCAVLSNLVTVYRTMKDTSGLSYAHQCYEAGIRSEDPYFKCVGSFSLSSMLYIAGDFRNAVKYAEEAKDIAEKNNMEYMKSEIYLVYGNICNSLGRYDDAEKYFRLTGEYSLKDSPVLYTEMCASYGKMLNNTGRYREAINILRDGIEVAKRIGSKENIHILYYEMSNAYSNLNNSDSAWHYYRMYHEAEAKLTLEHNERKANNLMNMYEKAAYKNAVQEREMKLIKANRSILVVAFILIIISIAALALFINNRRKNRMYAQLVEQHQNFMQRIKTLQNEQHTEKPATEDDSKEKALWEKLSSLMNDEKIYRKKDLSLDSIAEMLQTNRTYVSRIINKYANGSFYDYINSFRIEEAIAILSDPDNDIQIKALFDLLGYNSNSAFYRAFVKETGCPPTAYREQIKKRAEN